MNELTISEFQECALDLPLDMQIIPLLGGKGGGKSHLLCLFAIQWGDIHHEKARVLMLRKHYPDLEGLVATMMSILADLYGGKEARKMYNGSDNFFKLPNGAFIQLGGLALELDHLRYRGRNWNMLIVDEAPMYPGPKLINLVRAELRGGEGMLPRFVFSGNPGLEGHDWIERRFLRNKKPWEPWTEPETGLKGITIPSTARDNPFLDHEEHMRQIAAIAQNDKELAEALQTGNWGAITSGEFFGDCYSAVSTIINDWPELPNYGWSYFWALDHGGGSSPTAALACALAMEGATGPWGDYFPRGSLVVLDEVHDAVVGDWTETLGNSIAANCEQIKRTADKYDMRAQGIVDPQVNQDHGDDSKLIDTYTANGVSLTPWPKHLRANSASVIRELMHHARREERKKPGLYITRRCQATLATVPLVPRDRRKRDVPQDGGADHWLDALAGAAMHRRDRFTITELIA
jgi:hypothetical protein